MEVRSTTSSRRKKDRRIQGKLHDLEKAFKQLPRHPSHAELAFIALREPKTDATVYFEAVGLPFGARNSVFAFCAAARSLEWLANLRLLLPTTHYADDFSHIEVGKTAAGGGGHLCRLFDLVGWR